MPTQEMDIEGCADPKAGSAAHADAENPNKESESNSTNQPVVEEPPSCVAQAAVKTPWVDINAKFHMVGTKRQEKKEKKNPESAAPVNKRSFFSMPKFKTSKKKNGKAKDSAAQTTPDHSADIVTGGEGLGQDDWQDLSVPNKKRIWQGWEGLVVSIFGIAAPSLMLLLACMSVPKRITLVLLNHPLETIGELLLLLCIPLANHIVWSALCKNNHRFTLRRGIMLGSAMASSLIVTGVCIAAIFAGTSSLGSEIGTDFTGGFMSLAIMALVSCGISLHLGNRVRLTHDFQRSRIQVIVFTVIGAVLTSIAFLTAESRPWSVRMAERKALSTKIGERIEGLQQLRSLEAERELLLECSDSRAAGLSGLFIPIKTASMHQLYFTVTGRPYSFKDISNTDLSSMPDDYLQSHVVGDKIPGLSMQRSYITGVVHPNTLSSKIEWTFVFKNDLPSNQEARAEIGLPPGAVIDGLTLWKKGEPQSAIFAASGKAEGAENFTQVGHDSPAIIDDLGHGRVLVHCSPVSQTEELKVKVTMVVPLKADGLKTASLALPKFIATNFDTSGEHQLRLRSDRFLNSTAKGLTPGVSSGGQKAISGTLTQKQLENSSLVLTVDRSEVSKPIIVLDKLAIKMRQEDEHKRELRRLALLKRQHKKQGPQEQVVVMIDGSKGIQNQLANIRNALAVKVKATNHKKKPQIKTITPQYVVENVVRTAAPAPKHLVIVVDGSATMNQYKQDLIASLKGLPNGVPTSVIVASQEQENPAKPKKAAEQLRPMTLKDGLAKISQMKFIGGQDNLPAMIKAAEIAGETKGGAVLWAHGPQPVVNEEIYIMPPYVAAPSFYELPLGSGDTDTYDFFKNHTEIGPFLPVPRNTDRLANDVETFFSKWRPDRNGYAVSLRQMTAKPEHSVIASPEEAEELLALHANQEVVHLLTTRHIRRAARVAVGYGLVTPVSCALISENTNSNVDVADDLDTGDAANDGKDTSENGSDQEQIASTENPSPQSNEISAAEKAELQGVSNGTIGAQGSDATFVTGVNTAGTVRVNNLANLEALLNIIANLAEMSFMLVGIVIVVHSLINKTLCMEMMGQELELSQAQRIVIGVMILLFGLAFPGLINWFVASARDANLFS